MKKSFSIFIVLLALAALPVQAQGVSEGKAPFTYYLMTYFDGHGPMLERENIRMAISRDAFHWRALNGDEPVLASDTIAASQGIRDPFILRGAYGEYLIVGTDMYAARDGWGGPNPGIVLLRSDDLVHWTHHKVNLAEQFPKHFGQLLWMWAPQVIYDRVADKYLVYFTTKWHDSDYHTYYAYTDRAFTHFVTEPKVLFEAKYGCIDNDLIQGPDGLFHLFYKGNYKDAQGHETINGVQQAVAKRIRGPYVENYVYIDPYAGSPSIEGPSCFKLNNSDQYMLMNDLFAVGRYEYQLSTDLKTWTRQTGEFTKDFYPRHGGVISLTKEEAQRLAKAFPSENLDSMFVDVQ